MEAMRESRQVQEEDTNERRIIHEQVAGAEREALDSESYFESSLFVDESYVLRDYHIGGFSLSAYSLQASSTDFDLTGQLVWIGAEVLNDYLCQHEKDFAGASILELGSGVGLTGILCSKFCSKVVMTDHNDTVLKVMERNAELQRSRNGPYTAGSHGSLECAKLNWGNEEHIQSILEKHPEGFDFILGADICYQHESLGLLFDTVVAIMKGRPARPPCFILGYVTRWNSIGKMLSALAASHNLDVQEALRIPVDNGFHEGIVFQMKLKGN